jgi:polysaccharide deacetylase 2 family uncharacterized protein YibQ
MAFGGKIALPSVSQAMLWRLILGALFLLAVVLMAMLWMSGERETRTAMEDGRRLLIRLDTNAIEGKQVMLEQKPVPPPAPADTKSDAPPAAAPETPAPDAALPSVPAATVTPSSSAVPPINPALTQETPDGPLPIISGNGLKSWQYYAKPYERKGSLPMIAIIVGGLGANKAVAESALALPETVTLSFSPYARDIGNWVIAARASGHEMMLDLPLELSTYPASDPGPYGLLVGNNAAENSQRLSWLMSRFAGYIGFLMPQNEAFSSNNEGFKALLKTLAERGLMLVIGNEPAKSETKSAITDSKVANIVADVLIDEELSPDAIQMRLLSLQQIAKERGFAVGVAQPYPITMQQLAAWSAKLEQAGFVLVPVSFATRLKIS